MDKQTNCKFKSILIVEDDKDIRETLRLALELEGYHTTGAANGQEGIEILKQIEGPCLILLDLMMPVMNGWQFVEALRGEDNVLASIPVVVVSAYNDKAKTIESQGFVKKPVDLDVLLQLVNAYCS